MSVESEAKQANALLRKDRFVCLQPEERAVIFAVREVPYGAVEVVIHQSRIVQIMKTEKVRV